MKVKDKRIIVTGAGNGMGKEITKLLLSKGAFVEAIDINEENLKTLKNELNNENLSTTAVDVSSDESINSFVKSCEGKQIDGLINNAGIIQPFVHVENLEMNLINKVMNVNFYGPLKLTKAFLPRFLKLPEAHIVNISSMGGFFPFPGQTVYGASKAAVKLFTEGLYAELLGTNVKVTLVFPGAIATNITANSGVEMKTDASSSSMKMLSPEKAAQQIINGMEENKFQLYVGSDSKMMNLMYKLSPKKAIKLIKEKMENM